MNQDIQGEINSFIYDESIDTSLVQNIMLIHNRASELHKYTNTNTFYIIYNYNSTREDLLTLLRDKFQTLKHVGIAFHYTDSIPYFLNNEKLFEDKDLEKNTYSGNVQFIIDLINEFKVTNVDYLACNTLENDKYKQYYNILLENTNNVIIGASDNKTGNLKYGGDWIMENTKENVQEIYFTSEIENYSSLLADDPMIYTENNIIYRKDVKGLVYVGISRAASGSIEILSSVTSTIDGKSYEVTSIGENAFLNCAGVTSVTIPNTITLIDNYSFSGCSGITSIVIPDSVKTIENNAFNSCTILKSVTIGNNVTRISDQAFQNCTSLITITIPKSVIEIANSPTSTSQCTTFSGCTSLQKINVDSDNKIYTDINGVLYTKASNPVYLLLFPPSNTLAIENIINNKGTFTIPNNVTIRAKAFDGCKTLKNIILPSEKNFKITNYAFFGCKSLEYIGENKIQVTIDAKDNVTAIPSFSSNITNIGEGAFQNCISLIQIVLPNNVINIENYAFNGCESLIWIYISSNVKNCGPDAFLNIIDNINPDPRPPKPQPLTIINITNSYMYKYFFYNSKFLYTLGKTKYPLYNPKNLATNLVLDKDS